MALSEVVALSDVLILCARSHVGRRGNGVFTLGCFIQFGNTLEMCFVAGNATENCARTILNVKEEI